MSVYTENELKAIDLLKQKLNDLNLDEETNSDQYLVRWLQAQDFNVIKAEEMLRKSLIWREQYKMDSILDWIPPSNFKKAFPSEVCGYDADGNAIIIVPMKHYDTNLFWEIEKMDYVKYRIQLIEKVVEEMKIRNKSTSFADNQIILVYDLDGFNVRNMCSTKTIEYTREVGRIIDENYPEITKAAYITYAPRMMSFVISIVKPFLPRGAVRKSKIYGFDKTNWAPEILKHLPASSLPPRFGGTNTEFEQNAFESCTDITSK